MGGLGLGTHPLHLTTHSRPEGLTGPASLSGLLLASSWSVGPGIALPGTHLYTPPWYPPGLHAPPVTRTTPVTSTRRACTYDRFRHPVGEPRGVEHSHVSGSLDGLLRLWRFTRPFDWVLDCFVHVLLSLGPCFTEIRTLFY